ncbi:unnamed protein product [Linum tenue]|uniref:Uncharacterized protein n=1 Tax=Linum tenue TaxID=586396 RepID=A0AAV0P9Q3_9ROSI|nr:unnamed protein product [Linum tenue]CAI0467284.1 unnamed protein product [Linum tenue]
MASKSKSPVFPMPTEPHHFSDYGFDPQIDYFQFLEEAKKHKLNSTTAANSIDTLHFKLQKPLSRDESLKATRSNKAKIKKRWWKNALVFFKLKWAHTNPKFEAFEAEEGEGDDVHRARARALRATMSGPVYYITESRSGSNTPYRTTTSRPASGPLAGSLSPAVKGDIDLPYVSLRELNMERQQQRMSTSALPIYLVT